MRRNATWEKKSRRLETFVSWIFFFTANISREEVSYIFGSSMIRMNWSTRYTVDGEMQVCFVRKFLGEVAPQ